MSTQYPYYLANRPVQANTDLAVQDKFSGETIARVALADADALDRAIAAAAEAREAMAILPAYQRRDILQHCVSRFGDRYDELAQLLCAEAGKPIKDAEGEVDRLIDTFRIAAEEAVRLPGEIQTLDISARAKGYRGFIRRVPIGPCGFISAFNFPLNLTAHKMAPALAVGCPFVLKPASRTPLGALVMAEVLAETDLPTGAFSVLPMNREAADALTTDDRLCLLSFTGSPDVGWPLKKKAGRKKVVLELGGNAACIVAPDWDLEDAVTRIVFGAFYQSGQSCIGVQRIFVHDSIYARFKAMLLEKTRALVVGPPAQRDTFIGPMISEKEAQRVEDWITQAVEAGAHLLCGGQREGSMLHPSLLENVPEDQPVSAEEAFGPVAVLAPYSDFDTALEQVNASRFGLQAGIFTRDWYQIQKAWDRLEVGGVIMGDVPSYRVDNMPYGGVKDSGLGREGVRFAMEDMSEIRNLVIRTP